MGGTHFRILSDALIPSPNCKGMFILAHDFSSFPFECSSGHWLSSSDLSLQGELVREWDMFVHNMHLDGINISIETSMLVWAWWNSSEIISTNSFYNAITSTLYHDKVIWWYALIRKWDFPIKLNIFTWIILKNKILSWKNLQNRGFQGPNICVLYRNGEENVDHLFLRYEVEISLWASVLDALETKISSH